MAPAKRRKTRDFTENSLDILNHIGDSDISLRQRTTTNTRRRTRNTRQSHTIDSSSTSEVLREPSGPREQPLRMRLRSHNNHSLIEPELEPESEPNYHESPPEESEERGQSSFHEEENSSDSTGNENNIALTEYHESGFNGEDIQIDKDSIGINADIVEIVENDGNNASTDENNVRIVEVDNNSNDNKGSDEADNDDDEPFVNQPEKLDRKTAAELFSNLSPPIYHGTSAIAPRSTITYSPPSESNATGVVINNPEYSNSTTRTAENTQAHEVSGSQDPDLDLQLELQQAARNADADNADTNNVETFNWPVPAPSLQDPIIRDLKTWFDLEIQQNTQKEEWKKIREKGRLLRGFAVKPRPEYLTGSSKEISELRQIYTEVENASTFPTAIQNQMKNLREAIKIEATRLFQAAAEEHRDATLIDQFEAHQIQRIILLVMFGFRCYKKMGHPAYSQFEGILELLLWCCTRIYDYSQLDEYLHNVKARSRNLRLSVKRVLKALNSGDLNRKVAVGADQLAASLEDTTFTQLDPMWTQDNTILACDVATSQRPWTSVEMQALRAGLQRFEGQDNHIALIFRYYGDQFRNRTYQDLVQATMRL
ncbi:hypothetical protein N7462_010558 [Penicillium macrosclerotiorum]|uniref:uncharacterized protein n=1 Tax=Penicillium macrosclerotiorum TaxID=303699 RepID=UPI002546CF62|nr:uncharacterized protein N7462_010558 [Penicillium macrosclerotiorum]KAJ5669488.1 hypothetical protein N7462_010558 [Penicillium macrosclerotiorum]